MTKKPTKTTRRQRIHDHDDASEIRTRRNKSSIGNLLTDVEEIRGHILAGGIITLINEDTGARHRYKIVPPGEGGRRYDYFVRSCDSQSKDNNDFTLLIGGIIADDEEYREFRNSILNADDIDEAEEIAEAWQWFFDWIFDFDEIPDCLEVRHEDSNNRKRRKKSRRPIPF